MNQKLIVFLLIVYGGLASFSAQTVQVTGTVTDKNGEPLVGATVVEKGTTNGTIVLDGVQLKTGGISGNSGNFLSLINPNDFKSMTVLKDRFSGLTLRAEFIRLLYQQEDIGPSCLLASEVGQHDLRILNTFLNRRIS